VYLEHRYDGAFFAVNGNGLCGVDFDKCLVDGRIADPQIARWVALLDAYLEISPSGRGLRLFLFGTLPEQDRRIGHVEVYSDKRFLSITGNVPEWASRRTIEHRQEQVLQFHREAFAERIAKRDRAAQYAYSCASRSASAPVRDDERLLALARGFKNGALFRALYDEGAWQARFASRSEATRCLISRLLFLTHNNEPGADRLFRASKMMNEKWLRADYRQRTFAAARHEEKRPEQLMLRPPSFH
jgi:putative DNA primase/helicase